jgi:hypothetical protein
MKTTSALRYDFWDILRAPRLALSGKYLLAQARPLVYGYVVYLFMTYLAMLVEGDTLRAVWGGYALFPFVGLGLSHWYSWAIWVVGIVIAIGFYDYGNMIVAKLAIEELKGNQFFSTKNAAIEARANLRPLWVAAALLIILIISLSLIQGLIGLVVLIPYIGEILYAVIYAIPFVLWSLFVVFLAFGLTTAIFTLPAIVTAREKDAFGATFYIYNLIWTQPLRWVSQTAIGLVMAKLGIFVFGYFLMRALQLTYFTTSLISGEKVKSIVSTGYFALAPVQEVLRFFTSLYPGSTIDWMPSALHGLEFTLASQPTTEVIASLIILITLVIVWIIVISYGLNVITCSQLIGFIYIRKCEDGEKLGESPAQGDSDLHELIPKSPSAPESGVQSK